MTGRTAGIPGTGRLRDRLVRGGPGRPSLLARILLLLVTGYRRCVSPLLGPHCRFAPTCSAYAGQAVLEHGALRGSWLALRRLLRCHPFSPGGHDPVPAKRSLHHGERARRSPPVTPSSRS